MILLKLLKILPSVNKKTTTTIRKLVRVERMQKSEKFVVL